MDDDERSLMHLIFKVRDTLYGFELPYVQEVIQLPELTCIAKMPHGIAGFLNLRQEIICVVDMPVSLGYDPRKYSLNDYIIIIRKGQMVFGVLVSEILDIKAIQQEPGEPAPNDTQEHKNVLPLVSSIARFDNEIVFILDPELIYNKVARAYDNVNMGSLLQMSASIEFNVSPEERLVFQERVRSLSKKQSAQVSTSLTPLTVIQLNQEYFGVDPEIIKEFTRIEDYTPLPSSSAPDCLLGFINIRGEILSLIDLWQVLKSEPLIIKETSKILVISAHEMIVGILVDDVLDVIFVKPEEFRVVPLGMQKAHEEFIKQTVVYDKEVMGVLNLAKVMETILHATQIAEK